MTTYFPFHGERILLKAFEPEDIPAIQTYLNHPEMAGRRYIPWEFPFDFHLSKKQVEGIYDKWSQEKKGVHLAVILRGTQELVGHAEWDWGWDPHCPQVSVVIDAAHQREGYGSEVLGTLLRYLYENTPAHKISGWMAEWNQAARYFVKKHGFQESGRWRRDGIREGKLFYGILVDILRPEWEEITGGDSHAA